MSSSSPLRSDARTDFDCCSVTGGIVAKFTSCDYSASDLVKLPLFSLSFFLFMIL